jgi:D-alanyl-D-alanine carboxypeptidase/D-alanyl-D-alanine-endopeptidase (penicillin-binding protein 4)
MMLTSFCYQPAVGIAMAGTTLVGQAIGAHHRDWAFKIGNGIIVMAVIYMGAIGVVLAALGPWFLPWFTNAADPDSGMVVKRAGLLLWIAAGYQLFDGLNISSSAILRGAADVRLPAIMVLALSWLVFVPLAHSLSFAPGAGWVDWLPQYGLGAAGGWCAALVYVCCLGLTLALRWWSGAWQRITLPLSLAAIAVLASFHPRDARAAEIPAPVAQSMAVQRLPRSTVSFIVVDPDSGRAVASLNAETPRSPASTVKVVTTFAALDMLGPAYTWHTRALARGAPADGVLEGDLYLQGGGDPYMTLERWWSFAQSLRAAGLKTIRGDVVIDDTAFSLPPGNPGDFDGRPNRSYNVLPDALMVNFQSIEFRVAPDRSANRVDIVAVPSPANLDIENHVRLGRGRCGGANGRVDFEVASPQWDKVVFSGTLSPHCTERSFARVLLKPATYAFGTFVRLWRELGGEIDGKLRVEAAPADAAVLVDFDSLTLGEIVRLTNKFSSNLMARHLLLTLGEERSGAPGTLEKGAAAIADWGRAAGLDLSGVDIDNGSGLSRTTRITAEQLAAVLRAAYRSRFAPEFMASLPLGGIDGTLRARLRSSPAGAVRLKTGHLDGVTGIAGYVSAASGKTYVVVSLVNDNRADYGAGDSLHTALVDWILDTL